MAKNDVDWPRSETSLIAVEDMASMCSLYDGGRSGGASSGGGAEGGRGVCRARVSLRADDFRSKSSSIKPMPLSPCSPKWMGCDPSASSECCIAWSSAGFFLPNSGMLAAKCEERRAANARRDAVALFSR